MIEQSLSDGRALWLPFGLAAAVGRYTRRVVEVQRLDGAGPQRALLYSGTVDNPNFWWGEGGGGLDLDLAARVIATAEGPSGPNADYLSSLSAWLRGLGRTDPHVVDLESRVAAVVEVRNTGQTG